MGFNSGFKGLTKAIAINVAVFLCGKCITRLCRMVRIGRKEDNGLSHCDNCYSLTFMGPCILIIFQYIYPTRCNVTQFISSGSCSTCFGWYLHPSSGAQTTVSTACGICHAVTAICRDGGRVGTPVPTLPPSRQIAVNV